MSGKCAYCGKELICKPKEHQAMFSKRKYCNKICVVAHQRETGHWRGDIYIGRESNENRRYSY